MCYLCYWQAKKKKKKKKKTITFACSFKQNLPILYGRLIRKKRCYSNFYSAPPKHLLIFIIKVLAIFGLSYVWMKQNSRKQQIIYVTLDHKTSLMFQIFSKYPTVNRSKLDFWLVICIAMNLIWTTLKAIFSMFWFFFTLRFQIFK